MGGKLYLVYDTETTGLPKNWGAPVEDVENWPRIVQFCFGIYNEKGKEISFSNFIIIPEGFEIPAAVAEIHGVTQERAMAEGVSIKNAMAIFAAAALMSNAYVAHNIGFDRKVVGAEIERIKKLFGTGNDFIPLMEELDTMKNGTALCKIPGARGGYKWPKLQELHMELFGENFDGAHDAMNDVRACAKCFFEMKKRNLI